MTKAGELSVKFLAEHRKKLEAEARSFSPVRTIPEDEFRVNYRSGQKFAFLMEKNCRPMSLSEFKKTQTWADSKTDAWRQGVSDYLGGV